MSRLQSCISCGRAWLLGSLDATGGLCPGCVALDAAQNRARRMIWVGLAQWARPEIEARTITLPDLGITGIVETARADGTLTVRWDNASVRAAANRAIEDDTEVEMARRRAFDSEDRAKLRRACGLH